MYDPHLNEAINQREPKESQEDYCDGCVMKGGCNVFLKDGESCADRLVDKSLNA